VASPLPAAPPQVQLRHLSLQVCVFSAHRSDRRYAPFFLRAFSASLRLLCPRLTPRPPSHHLSRAVATRAAAEVSPGNAHTPPRSSAPHLHHDLPDKLRTSTIFAVSSPSQCLVCGSCSSRWRFACGFLQTPPRGGRPCRPASTSPCRACRGLEPPSVCALPGAQKKEQNAKAIVARICTQICCECAFVE